jgi:hypothetical protein
VSLPQPRAGAGARQIDASLIVSGTVDVARLPDTNAAAVRETSGPTLLTIGAVGDGEYLRRDGSTVVGGTPSGGGGGGDLSMASLFVVGSLTGVAMPPLGAYAASNGTTAGIDILRISAVPIGMLRALTGLVLGVAGNVADAVLRMGLYECGPDGYPTALLFDSGTLAAATANTRLLAEPVSPIALSPAKRYAVAYIGGVAAPNLRLVTGGTRLGSITTVSTAGVVTIGSHLSAAQAFGALPATAPAGMAVQSGTTTPFICLVGTL